MDFCAITDRKIDRTCGRSPNGRPREAADSVPGATTMDTGMFIEDFTTCRGSGANRRRTPSA
jgi:hypothetical protein